MRMRFSRIGFGLVLSLAMAVAQAEVVVVVAAQNPLQSLSHEQLSSIYLGHSYRFPNGDIAIPIDQAEQSRAYREFYHDYLHRSPVQMRAHWSKLIFTGRGQPPRAVRDDAAVADTVAANPNAIGYIDPAYLDDRLKQVLID